MNTPSQDAENVLEGPTYYTCVNCDASGIALSENRGPPKYMRCMVCHGSGKIIDTEYEESCARMGIEIKRLPLTSMASLLKVYEFGTAYGQPMIGVSGLKDTNFKGVACDPVGSDGDNT